jgi:hypothetical protein
MQALLADLWGERMDGLSFGLMLFLIATFVGAVVAGLSGFAFGLVAASLWLYILTPLQSATLIVAFGLIVQGYSVWKLRHALDWRKLWPFVLGAAFGVPAGVALLTWSDPRSVRVAVGIFLVLVQPLRVFPPGTEPDQVGRRRGGCRGRLSQWGACGPDRTRRDPGDDLDRPARLD